LRVTTEEWKGSTMPPDPGYHIFYNYTAPQSFGPELVKLVSESILAIKSGSTDVTDDAKRSRGTCGH
jgi:hypothetical protein